MSGREVSNLLSSRRFLPLFITQFLGAFGDNFIRTALVSLLTFQALDLSDLSRAILVTLAMSLFMLPFIIISATGGQLADKYDKAKLIQWVKFCRIFVMMLGILGFYLNSYLLLLFSILLIGAESALFGPVKYSILPDHLKKNELLMANGLIEAGTFIAILLGIISGGIAISPSFGGVNTTCIALFIISITGFISTLYIPNTNPASPSIKINPNFTKETISCVRTSKEDNESFLAILGISWFWMIGGVMMSQMPTLTRDIFSADQSVYIMLLTAFSIGTGVGSILCNNLLKGHINTQYVPISILFMTFFMFIMWYAGIGFVEREHLSGIHYFLSSLKGIAVLISTFLMALFGGIYIVPLYALLQVRAKPSHRSRVIASNNILNALFIVVATGIVMGLLAIGFEVSDILLLTTIINFITAVYICRILPHTIIKNIFQTIFKLLYRVEIRGLDNYYKAGDKVLIIANHASFIDPPILGAFLPARMTFAIDTFQAKSWWIRPLLSYLRALPIDPTNSMAAKTLIEQLKKKIPVVIFPEGRITVTGSLMKIYEGPGMIADKAGAKLLPIRIDGAQYSPFSRLHGKINLRLFPKITVTILEPQKIEVDSALVGRERRKEIGHKLYEIMSKMMFEGSEQHQTLFQSLIEAADQHGKNHVILEDADHNKISYNRILLGSFMLGKKIAEQTEPGEFVGILLPNTAGTCVTFFANLAYNRIPAMLNFSTGIKNILFSCKAAKIKTIYTARKFVEKANYHNNIEELTKNGYRVVYLEDLRKKLTIFDKVWGVLAAKFPTAIYKKINNFKIPDPTTPAVVLFTSGSEGLPKGVVLSHTNIQANIKQAASRVDFSSSDVVFNALPIFHSFGLTGGMLMPVLSGVKVFMYPSPLHYRIIPEMVYGSNATLMFGTDTFLSGYARFAHPYDFFSVRYIFAGAEKLREETRKTYMEKFGVRIFEGYGATEAAPIISVNTPMHYRSGTVGRLLPNIQHYIEKVEGIEEGGKLIIKGPNIMLGYLRPEKPGVIESPSYKINGKTQKNWYDTGDIVDVDEDGYIKILGRVKRFAKIGGEMISLAAVEEIIYSIWPNHVHAVVSLPHDKRGETLALFTTNPDAKKDNIISYIKKGGYTELFLPKVITYLNDIPVLATGKVDYVALKETLSSMSINDATSTDNADDDMEYCG